MSKWKCGICNREFENYHAQGFDNIIYCPLCYYKKLYKRDKKEIERLNNIIDTILEFSFFKEECPLNFGFGDKKEEKAQDVFYEDDYCEKNCNDIYKNCWLKYFEKLQKLKEE